MNSPRGTRVAMRATTARVSGKQHGSHAAVVFQVEAKVGFGEEIYVCGDTITLGDFDPTQGIQLFATTKSYPIWESKVVMLARGIMVQYKYAIYSGGKFSRFEDIKYNRFLLTDEYLKHKMQRPISANDDDDDDDEAATTSSDVLNLTPFLPPPAPPIKPVPTFTSSNQSVYGDWTKDAGGVSNIGRLGGIVVVSYFLPVLVSRDSNKSGGWSVEWDHEALLSCKTALLRVTRIGTVRLSFGEAPIKPSEQEAVTAALQPFFCYPIFIEEAIAKVFYNDFCKKTLWPVFHNLLEIYGSSPTGQALSPEEETKLPEDSAVADSLKDDLIRSSSTEDDASGFWYANKGAGPLSPPPAPPQSGLGTRAPSDVSTPLPPAALSMGVSPSFIAQVANETENILRERESSLGLNEMTGSTATSGEADKWASYMSVQRRFKSKIMEMYHEGDAVWIHGFHLLLVPTLLAKAAASVKMGIFLHTPFPSSEIFRTLSRREDLLRGMLSADQIGFHLYEYARHFLTCCRRLLGLEWTHESNGINIHYGGRSVLITVMHAGMDADVMSSLAFTSQVKLDIQELSKKTKGKTVFVGIDRLERLKGLPLKLLAYEKLLSDHPELVGKIVLYQISLSAKERGLDYELVKVQVQHLVDRINKRFGGHKRIKEDPEDDTKEANKEENLAILYEERSESDCQLKHRIALLTVADCFVVATVRDGLNRWPLEYALAQSLSRTNQTDSFDELKPPGVMILSEFTSCSRVLEGAIKVNPWKINEVAAAMYRVTAMDPIERNSRFELDSAFAKAQTAESWCGRVLLDLNSIKKASSAAGYVTLGFGLNRRITAMKPGFDQLDKGKVVKSYRRASKRLILLDYGGTLFEDTSNTDSSFHRFQKVTNRGKQPMKKKVPDSKLTDVLKLLCQDSKNIVYVLSGKGREDVSAALGDVNGLGLVAEAGFFFRRAGSPPLFTKYGDAGFDAQWERLVSDGHSSWKTIAKAVMEVYMERTHGVYIQEEESAVAWQFRDADPEFAQIQSKELEDQLKQLLKTLNVDVIRGEDYVEVRPKGISKGDFIRSVFDDFLDNKQEFPDFVLCIGDDASDEKSYQVVKRSMRMATFSVSLGGIAKMGATGNSLSVGSAPPPISENGSMPKPSVYFTSTVGKKPTLADSYLNSSDDVIEILQSFSKTAEHSSSSGNISSSNSLFGLFNDPNATNDSQPSPKPTGTNGFERGGIGAAVNHSPSPFFSGQTTGASLGPGGGSGLGGLHPISESPKVGSSFQEGADVSGGGTGEYDRFASSGSGLALSRSISTGSISTLSSLPMRRPSSMMLNEYFSNIADEKNKTGDNGDGAENDDGIWI